MKVIHAERTVTTRLPITVSVAFSLALAAWSAKLISVTVILLIVGIVAGHFLVWVVVDIVIVVIVCARDLSKAGDFSCVGFLFLSEFKVLLLELLRLSEVHFKAHLRLTTTAKFEGWGLCRLRLILHFGVSTWLQSAELAHVHFWDDLGCRSGLTTLLLPLLFPSVLSLHIG